MFVFSAVIVINILLEVNIFIIGTALRPTPVKEDTTKLLPYSMYHMLMPSLNCTVQSARFPQPNREMNIKISCSCSRARPYQKLHLV